MTTNSGYTAIDCYNFVLEYSKAHKGNTPSHRQIGIACGFSVATAHSCVQSLIKEGLLERIDNELCVVRSDFVLHADASQLGDGKLKTEEPVDILAMKSIPLDINGITPKKLKALGITLKGVAVSKDYAEATYPDGWRYEEIEGTNGENYLLVDEEGEYQAVLTLPNLDGEGKVCIHFVR